MKTCVCFYGLPQRSLKFTLENIKKNVLFDDPDIYVHTFDTTIAQCIRGGEPPTPIDPRDILYLKPTNYRIDSEEEFNSTFDFKKYEKFGNPFPGDPGGVQTLHNLLRELHSVQQVWEMIPDPNKYDRIIMTRADLVFSRDLDFECPPDTLLTQERPPGVINHNDFFAMGSPQAVEPWANRLAHAEAFCGRPVSGHIGLHPETLITYIIKRFELKDTFININPKRVRATGKIMN
jgi:hypothetical protein